SEADFEDLKEFIKEFKFDRLGVFEFSLEEDTAAVNLPNRISPQLKKERKEELLKIQQEISLEKNRELLEKELEVIIEAKNEDYYLARSRFDAPEIDNQIYIPIENNELEIGNIYYALITEAYHYELEGEIKDESTK
ncbi:MAG: 30S ribosomal protein S12 methylthiotransferase RimO, partial [Halanaerobium sp. MSAO_Bac5]